MSDYSYQPGIRHEAGGNQMTLGNGGILLLEPGSSILTSKGIGVLGTLLGAGALSVSNQDAQVHRDIFTLAGVGLTTVDDATNGAQASQSIFTFPRGNILFLGGTFDLTVTGDGVNQTTTATLVAALGSAAAGADATLTSTEADFIPSAAGTFTASIGHPKGHSTATKFFDNTTTTNATQLQAILNCAIPTAGSSGAGVLLVTGTVNLCWLNLGDN